MINIILFDQDTLFYRQSIYYYFRKKFKDNGYNLTVVYDIKLNNIRDTSGLFIGIDYSYRSFRKIIKNYNCKIIIQFVWLRYKFIIPFMLINRMKGIKTIVWSHGINLQRKKQIFKNRLYYIRQMLANALIIYNIEQIKYIKVSREKVFVANNTLNFYDFPNIKYTKEELKEKYGFVSQKILITISRMNTNNRKVEHLIELAKIMDPTFTIIIIGPGISEKQVQEISKNIKIRYLGIIYDQKIICEYYKMADLFVMPGAIGLSINQAFYFGVPVVVEENNESPEVTYLKNGENGFYYEKDNIDDLYYKIKFILNSSNYNAFSMCAKNTIMKEASVEKMFLGFIKSVRYVNGE